MNKILVVGAGYLGSEICFLMSSEYDVYPTSLSGRQGTLKLDTSDPGTFLNIPSGINHVVYCVSAKSGELDSYKSAYFHGVSNLLAYSETKNIKSFTFVSSTGVYKENVGGEVDETSLVTLDSNDRSRSIVEGELLVLNQNFTLGRVCRLSGIYGPGREYFINYSEQYQKPIYDDVPSYSNRIHKKDAARAIQFLIDNNLAGIWNVSDKCPSKRLEVINYIRLIKGLDLVPLSEFYVDALEKNNATGKKVNSSKLSEAGYEFLFPSYREGYSEMLGA